MQDAKPPVQDWQATLDQETGEVMIIEPWNGERLTRLDAAFALRNAYQKGTRWDKLYAEEVAHHLAGLVTELEAA